MKIHVLYESKPGYKSILEWLYFASPSFENQLLDEIDSETFPRSSLPLEKMQKYHGLEMKGIVKMSYMHKKQQREHKKLDKRLSQLPKNCSTNVMIVRKLYSVLVLQK